MRETVSNIAVQDLASAAVRRGPALRPQRSPFQCVRWTEIRFYVWVSRVSCYSAEGPFSKISVRWKLKSNWKEETKVNQCCCSTPKSPVSATTHHVFFSREDLKTCRGPLCYNKQVLEDGFMYVCRWVKNTVQQRHCWFCFEKACTYTESFDCADKTLLTKSLERLNLYLLSMIKQKCLLVRSKYENSCQILYILKHKIMYARWRHSTTQRTLLVNLTLDVCKNSVQSYKLPKLC